MNKKLGIAILAAGAGKRLKGHPVKALAPLGGQCLVDFPLGEALGFARKAGLEPWPMVVTGHGREEVEGYLSKKYLAPLHFAPQPKQLGTADALRTCFASSDLARQTALTLVLCADTPLVRQQELELLYQALEADPALQAVAAVFKAPQPHGYGRIVPGESGFHIVEQQVANDEIKKISLVNSGLYLFRTPFLRERLSALEAGTSSSSDQELYLTDVFQDCLQVKALAFPNASSFLGVNTPEELCNARYHLHREINNHHQANGVYIVDNRHTYIDWDVTIGPGSVIHPNNFIYQGTQLGSAVTIEPNCTIKGSIIKDGAFIKSFCYLEFAAIGKAASIGPFARIREGSEIGAKAKVGNFVEIKRAKLQEKVKVSHLSYVGDAEIGEQTNIGCGFITCNYDGAKKHKTTIGKRAFVGSDSQTIAPVSIGDDAYIGSGSTITKDVPAGAFAVARARQINREEMAKRFKK